MGSILYILLVVLYMSCEDSPALVVIQGEHERPAKRIDGEEYSFIVYKNY